MVGHIDRSINAIKEEEVAFNPFAECKVFDINVTCSRGGFLRVSHVGATIVIFVEECSCFLGYIEVPEYASNKEDHFTCVASGHEFGFGRGSGNGGLKFTFVGDGTSGKSYAHTTKRVSCFDAGSPVQICISVSSSGIKLWSVVKEDVLLVAVNRQ
jgi:hypothetical protein